MNINSEDLNTILGALRLYQKLGNGNPDVRPDWLQKIVAPTIDDTSLDNDGIDRLCEELNCENIHVTHQRFFDDLEILRLSIPQDDNTAWDAWSRICRVFNP